MANPPRVGHVSLLRLGTLTSIMLRKNLEKPPGSFYNGLEPRPEVLVRKVAQNTQPISIAMYSRDSWVRLEENFHATLPAIFEIFPST